MPLRGGRDGDVKSPLHREREERREKREKRKADPSLGSG
jgi:hypothetical protein